MQQQLEDLWFKVLHLQYANSPEASLAYQDYRKAMRRAFPYALFLDDERQPQDVIWKQYPTGLWWHTVRTVGQFKTHIELNGLPSFVSLDHDLQDFVSGIEYTGMDCAKFLTDYCTTHVLPLPVVCIHSKNGPGKDNIASWFASYLKATPINQSKQ